MVLRELAESLHYATKGKIEKEARKEAWRRRPKPGGVYVTSAGGLKARWILHAVTMRLPGTLSSAKTVESCLRSVLSEAKNLNLASIAIPALGTGTGRVDIRLAADLYADILGSEKELEIVVVDPSGSFSAILKQKLSDRNLSFD